MPLDLQMSSANSAIPPGNFHIGGYVCKREVEEGREGGREREGEREREREREREVG